MKHRKEVCRARLDGWLGLGLDELHDGLLDRVPRRRRLRGGRSGSTPAAQGQLAHCSRSSSSSRPATVTSAPMRTRCSTTSGSLDIPPASPSSCLVTADAGHAQGSYSHSFKSVLGYPHGVYSTESNR